MSGFRKANEFARESDLGQEAPQWDFLIDTNVLSELRKKNCRVGIAYLFMP